MNQPQLAKFRDNSVSTGKYTVISFLPKFLYEQFRKYANIFFLTIGLLQQIDGISPTGKYVTLVPFLIILSITAIKELVEDLRRHLEDGKINNSEVLILRGDQGWQTIYWKNLKVGDIVKINCDANFPSDLICLASAEEEPQCYIETANLDGETNLKIRSANTTTKHLKTVEQLTRFQAEIEAEGPNKNLYDFSGTITVKEGEKTPIGPNEILLRGSKLRNTKWIYGIAVYTGSESKLMMNSTQAPLKQSTMEKEMNKQIIFLFFILVAISLISSGVNKAQEDAGEKQWYVTNEEDPKSNFFLNFLTFFILYNNLIPISLLVSLEMVRVFQAMFINNDEAMHYSDTTQNIDTFAVAKTSNLNEELGQIKYVFSDKTGTLTKNIMVFQKCSIAGVVHEADKQISHFSEDVEEFLRLMSICHTVVPEKIKTEQVDGDRTFQFDTEGIHYNAASPDEKALVEGAAAFGFIFKSKTSTSITIQNHLKADETFELLAVIDFTSSRKRMSVIVRTRDQRIKLYCKGADNVILDRISKQPEQSEHKEATLQHLDHFAREGLRTLVLAYADISDDDFSEWNKKWKEATTALVDREGEVATVADLIERNLTLIGATAIEDALQDNVPSTIQALLEANIHVWMLTGDKQITAENIAKSCRLHREGTELLDVSAEEAAEVQQKISDRLADLGENKGRTNDLTLIIDGKSLTAAMEERTKTEFVELCTSCKAIHIHIDTHYSFMLNPSES